MGQRYFWKFYYILEHFMRKTTTQVLWLSMAWIIELLGGLHNFTFIWMLWKRGLLPSPAGGTQEEGELDSMAKGPQKACGRIWRWRGHPHVPCDADKGLLVINWSLSQLMALLHLLHWQPTAEPSGVVGKAPAHRMGFWPVLCAPPPNVSLQMQFTISSLFTYPHQGLGWIQQ